MKRKAFTLVELLVVIAIIALLISILAPSLNTVKTLAKRTIEATNTRSIGVAMAVYSGASKNLLPPNDNSNGASLANAYSGAPYSTYWAFDFGTTGGTTLGDGDISNFGCAYKAGVVGNEAIFYCVFNTGMPPSQVKYFAAAALAKPWDSAPPPNGDGGVRTNYMCNPNIKITDRRNWTPDSQNRFAYNSLQSFPSDVPMSIEDFGKLADTFHKIDNPVSWGMVYADGHVERKTQKAIVAQIMGGTDIDDKGDVKTWTLEYDLLIRQVSQ